MFACPKEKEGSADWGAAVVWPKLKLGAVVAGAEALVFRPKLKLGAVVVAAGAGVLVL